MNVLIDSDLAISSIATSPFAYAQAIEDLQNSACLSLASMKRLSYIDLNCLCEEIKCWCVYGNNDPKKLRMVSSITN
jgi:hypothetical protein